MTQKEKQAMWDDFYKALDTFAKKSGLRIKVKVRPQRGQVDGVSMDMDFNDPKLLALTRKA